MNFIPLGLVFSRLCIQPFAVWPFSSFLALFSRLLVTTTTKMPRAVLTTACLAPGRQDCRWDISYQRLKGIILSWRGIQGQAASLTSKMFYECISVDKLYLHLNTMPHPGIQGTGSSSASTRSTQEDGTTSSTCVTTGTRC